MTEAVVHEPGAEWLTTDDGDHDVTALSEALLQRSSETIRLPQGQTRRTIPMRAIRAVAQRIAERFQPEKIILFGSYAEGYPKPESDVDLLVIMETSLRSRQQRLEISRALSPRPFPLDIIVRTPRELAERIALGDLFLREVTTRGKVLYERDRS